MEHSLAELLDVDDPAWPGIEAAIGRSRVAHEVLPTGREAGEQCLHRLQVTARSTLGAMALHTGGLVVDHGWLRLLGAGAPGLPDLATINGFGGPGGETPPFLVVGFDAVGGRFAVNGGALPGEAGEIHYWGPDAMTWEPIGFGYTDLVEWALGGGLADFAESLRWTGWVDEVAAMPLTHGLLFVPPQCTLEGADLDAASRRPVPFGELQAYLDALAEVPGGEHFSMDATAGPDGS